MNYVNSCLVITMLLGVGYSQCNESNWQEYYPNMQGCNLAYADLGYTYLYMADLATANLEGANLYQANLQGVNFANANLQWANFANASCFGAFFAGANLDGTIFDGAGLTYTFFDDTGDCSDGEWSWIACDGYDDVSYDAGAESGDLNLDGIDNVLDVVILVENILNP